MCHFFLIRFEAITFLDIFVDILTFLRFYFPLFFFLFIKIKTSAHSICLFYRRINKGKKGLRFKIKYIYAFIVGLLS